jgi:hypothetical protein
MSGLSVSRPLSWAHRQRVQNEIERVTIDGAMIHLLDALSGKRLRSGHVAAGKRFALDEGVDDQSFKSE